MALPNCLFDPSAPLVLDASVLINLNATGFAAQILSAIPNAVVVTDVVAKELERGRAKGRTDADLMDILVKTNVAERVELPMQCEGNFFALVAGSGASTLDDGEAATISWAVSHGGFVVIDEKKGVSICQRQFPDLVLKSTIDLLAHENVQLEIGKSNLSKAIFNALTLARMRVFDRDIPWVISMIGQSRASVCNSLPRSARIANIIDTDKRSA